MQVEPQRAGKLALSTTRRPERVLKDSATATARKIMLDSRGRGSDSLRTTCSIITSYVQVNVSCIQDSCTASNIRRSPVRESVTNWTALEVSEGGTSQFLDLLNSPSMLARVMQRTVLEGYLLDPDSPFTTAIESETQQLDLTMNSVQDLYIRFAQLFFAHP